MRLGQLTRVAVPDTDLTLLVRVQWGEYRRLTAEIADKSEIDALPAVDRYLRAVIADVRGFVDAEGQPVEWTTATLDELPPALVMRLLGAMMNAGETGGDADSPLSAPEAVADAASAT